VWIKTAKIQSSSLGLAIFDSGLDGTHGSLMSCLIQTIV
jgi:hypothetical protein